MEQRSQEWFEARKGRVTASMAGAILGLDPYRTADDVLRAMVREYHGAEPEFTGNIATRWGQTNEEVALMRYQNLTGNEVEKCGFIEYPGWVGASPDGLVGDHGLVEIKCPFGIRNKPAPVPFKSISEQPHYYAQIQVQLHVTIRRWCDFFQWTPKGEQLQRVHYDGHEAVKMFDELRRFHSRYLSELNNPEHLQPKRVVIDTPKAVQLIQEYDDLRDAEERTAERRKEVLQEIIALAGERDAEIAGRKLTLVERKGSVSYAKALKDLAPDADLTPYTGKTSQSWRLT